MNMYLKLAERGGIPFMRTLGTNAKLTRHGKPPRRVLWQELYHSKDAYPQH
jgi:hypothetical protein